MRRVLRQRAATAASLLTLLITTAAPADASVANQWPLQYLGAAQDWNIAKGAGQTVAVLDTGVSSIPDTQAALLPGADFAAGTASAGNGQSDLDGHGTQMAVLIAGSGNPLQGLAPAAKILPIRVAFTSGPAPDSSIAAGIEYAISHHATVINLSFGVSPDAALAKAVNDAINADIVVVSATGNDGSSTVTYPAAYPGVVAVDAVGENGSLWAGSTTGPQTTLAAPGADVPAEDNTGQVGTADGTSASAAYVSATAALIRSEHPAWTAGQVIRDLITTAAPGPGTSTGERTDQYGYGVLDPLKALQASAPSQTTNPLLVGGATGVAPSSAASTGTAAPVASIGSSTPTMLIIGIVIAAVITALLVTALIILSGRRKNRPGGPGPSYGRPPYETQPLNGPYPGAPPDPRLQSPGPYEPPAPPQYPGSRPPQ